MAINTLAISGRLANEPSLKKTASGESISTFTLAIDNRKKNPDGTRGTTFIQCVAWGAQAEFFVEHVKKGDLVFANGFIQSRKYTRKDNSENVVLELNVENFQPAVSRKIEDSADVNDESKESIQEDSNDPFAGL